MAEKIYKVNNGHWKTDVFAVRGKYFFDNSPAIQLITADTCEPYARLTVCLDNKELKADTSYVDTNNCPWAEEFIKENELGEFTGEYGKSGFCTYPLYKFYLEKITEGEF